MDATASSISPPGGLSSSFALCPHAEDAHWRQCFEREPYHRSGLDYEDYAPAYCVGYVGFAQYGGTYEDARPSLCANWARLKGDSRLSPEEALAAIRAAWERLAAQAEQVRRTAARREGAMAAARGRAVGTLLADPGASSGFPHAPSFPVRRPVPAPQAE